VNSTLRMTSGCAGPAGPMGECEKDTCTSLYPAPLTASSSLCAASASGQYCLVADGAWAIVCASGAPSLAKCNFGCASDHVTLNLLLKLASRYEQIPSLEAIVIVSHREARVDVWSRSTDSPLWSCTSAAAGASAAVPPLGCLLDVDAIWRAAAEPP
jgi:hypothetical protein